MSIATLYTGHIQAGVRKAMISYLGIRTQEDETSVKLPMKQHLTRGRNGMHYS